MRQARKNGSPGASASSSMSLKKLFLLMIAMMGIVTATLIFVYSGETVEEIWQQREADWKQQEHAWNQEIADLEAQKEQLELVLSKHFIDHKQLNILDYSPSDSHAIVTVFGTDAEEKSPSWIHALILFQSLKETKCRVQNKVALSFQPITEIPLIGRNAFERLGVDLRHIGPLPRNAPSEDWRKMWMRSQVFLLTEFSRVLFMDSESIAIDNVDHVFMNSVPVDHPLEDERLVFTAQRQLSCEFHDSCKERRASSPRFFLIQPNQVVGKEVEARINSKSQEIMLDDMFSTEMHEILLWTPFRNDSYDWQIGECDCGPFVKRQMKTISFGCLRANKIFDDVLGRMWTEKECSHEWFILWIQLYSEVMEKLPR